jgi:hypothetical protein
MHLVEWSAEPGHLPPCAGAVERIVIDDEHVGVCSEAARDAIDKSRCRVDSIVGLMITRFQAFRFLYRFGSIGAGLNRVAMGRVPRSLCRHERLVHHGTVSQWPLAGLKVPSPGDHSRFVRVTLPYTELEGELLGLQCHLRPVCLAPLEDRRIRRKRDKGSSIPGVAAMRVHENTSVRRYDRKSCDVIVEAMMADLTRHHSARIPTC